MTFSIIIPTYNSSATLGQALNSIIEQSFKDFEILIMDGASSDKTVAIAQKINDPRISIYSEPDSGVYDAMNKGIARARGEWVYFLGSDDWLINNTVLDKINAHISPDIDIIYLSFASKY